MYSMENTMCFPFAFCECRSLVPAYAGATWRARAALWTGAPPSPSRLCVQDQPFGVHQLSRSPAPSGADLPSMVRHEWSSSSSGRAFSPCELTHASTPEAGEER